MRHNDADRHEDTCEHVLVQSKYLKIETQLIFLNAMRLWSQFNKFLGSQSLFYCVHLYILLYSNVKCLIIVYIDPVKLG